MVNETKFRWSNGTILVCLAMFVVLQTISAFIQVRFIREGDWTGVLFIEGVIAMISFGLLLQTLSQRSTRFYDDGISFVKFFKRRFIPWAEITQVSNVSLNQSPVVKLASKSENVRIILAEFKDKTEIVRFIDSKLNEANSASCR